MKELLKDTKFMMDAGFAKSSWKKWQQTLFEEARKYDRQLFTPDGIANLCDVLEYLGGKCRGDVEVRRPNWDDFLTFDLRPSISLGYGCSIPFTQVKGEYFNN